MKKEDDTSGIRLLIRCIVKDHDGKVVSDTGDRPANSFVLQFLEYIYYMALTGNQFSTTTDAGEQWIYYGADPNLNMFYVVAAIALDAYGIVVGTGDTAVDNEDIILDVQLTEGSALGEISHGEGTVGAAGVQGANVDMLLSRDFTNNTGAAISIKEVGVYARSGSRNFCIIRDLVGPVNVPRFCSLAVRYTIRTTV